MQQILKCTCNFFPKSQQGYNEWYNIIRYNKGSISTILQIDTIAACCVLLTDNLVALKIENHEPILAVIITEWRKLIDYFGTSINTNPSRVGKKNAYFSILGIKQVLHL